MKEKPVTRRVRFLESNRRDTARGLQRWRRGAGHRVLFHPNQARPAKVGPAQFDRVARPATLAGSTPHFHVYYADVLGQAGEKVAQAVLKNCDRDYQTLSGYFGVKQSLQFNIIIAPLSSQMDGTGGAYHHTCLAADLYCDVQLTPNLNPDVTNALVVAEEVEVFQAVQSTGWRCGSSNGEGLSRVLASELYPNVLENLGYSTARLWLNSRRPNLVGHTVPSDTNGVGNGCAVLFLNYLHKQLGFGWDKISQAAAPTLAGTYKKLTGKTAPFHEFNALLQKKFQKGQPVNLQTDDPFPINDGLQPTKGKERSGPGSAGSSKSK